MPEQELTLEDGRKALGVHVLHKGYELRQKYGTFIDFETLQQILRDDEFVRFPATIVFDSSKVEEGMFAVTEKVSEDPADGYIIYVHEFFKHRTGDLPALVFYHLVTVNYGDFASYNEAEVFGSEALGMKQDEYYQLICRLTDQIPD